MIQENLEKIVTKIQGAKGIPEETRSELVGLLTDLKTEIGDLSETHQQEAASIAAFAEVSTSVATHETVKPELVKVSVHALSSSVEGFETSHPALVQTVNRIATILSNMGI